MQPCNTHGGYTACETAGKFFRMSDIPLWKKTTYLGSWHGSIPETWGKKVELILAGIWHTLLEIIPFCNRRNTSTVPVTGGFSRLSSCMNPRKKYDYLLWCIFFFRPCAFIWSFHHLHPHQSPIWRPQHHRERDAIAFFRASNVSSCQFSWSPEWHKGRLLSLSVSYIRTVGLLYQKGQECCSLLDFIGISKLETSETVTHWKKMLLRNLRSKANDSFDNIFRSIAATWTQRCFGCFGAFYVWCVVTSPN